MLLVALDVCVCVCVCVCVFVCVCMKEQFVNYIVLQLLSSLFFHCDLDSTDMYIKMYIEQARTSGTTPGQICIEKAMSLTYHITEGVILLFVNMLHVAVLCLLVRKRKITEQ